MKRIPAIIAWPLVIVLLLLSNVAIAVGTLIVANQKGGVQVVPDYYAKAVAWDSLTTIQNDAAALGWAVTLKADRSSSTVTTSIVDRDGIPLSNLAAVVSVSRPQAARPIGTFELKATESAGVYLGSLIPYGGHGLYDFSITATKDELFFVDTARLDVK